MYAQNDVLRGGKQIHQLKMLVNHTDPVPEGILGRADDNLFPVDQDLAFIGKIDAGDHVHQGGFAASVFAQDGQDLLPVHIQVHAFVGLDGSESFADSSHLKGKLFLHGCSSVHKESV